MSLPIFQAYMDYCKENNIIPSVDKLREWKLRFNNR